MLIGGELPDAVSCASFTYFIQLTDPCISDTISLNPSTGVFFNSFVQDAQVNIPFPDATVSPDCSFPITYTATQFGGGALPGFITLDTANS